MNKKLYILVAIFVAFLSVYAGAKQYANSIAKEKIDAVIAQESHLVTVTYEDVDVNLFTKAVYITGATIQRVGEREKDEIEEVAILTFDGENEFPQFMDVELRGVQTDIAEIGKYSQALQGLGYKNVVSEMSFAYHLDSEKGILEVKKIGIGFADIGGVEASITMGNVDLGGLGNTANIGAFLKSTFVTGNLIYQDQSIAKKMFKVEAKKRNTTVKEFKELVILII